MKKVKLLIGALVLTGSVFAQKATLDNPWSLEGTINYDANNGMQWQAPSVRARYFVNENIAARVQLGVGQNGQTAMKESYVAYQNADGTGAKGTFDINRSLINIGLGAEYHLTGTDRLSPYFSLGINFGAGSSKGEASNYNPATDSYSTTVTSYTREGKISTFGVGVGAGFDFYVYENLYLGLELGLLLQSTNNKDVTEVVTTPAGSVTTVTPGVKDSYLNTMATSAIRLGWRF